MSVIVKGAMCLSISSCIFPSDLKMAEVSPIFKKDDRIRRSVVPLVLCQLDPSFLNA